MPTTSVAVGATADLEALAARADEATPADPLVATIAETEAHVIGATGIGPFHTPIVGAGR